MQCSCSCGQFNCRLVQHCNHCHFSDSRYFMSTFLKMALKNKFSLQITCPGLHLNIKTLCLFLLIPGEYGIPRPWYFIFQINYWGGVPLEAGMLIPPAPEEQGEGTRLHMLLHTSTAVLLRFFFCCHPKIQSHIQLAVALSDQYLVCTQSHMTE